MIDHSDEITNAEYHAMPGISKSGLDAVNRSPAHYWAQYRDPNRVPREETQAMKDGTAVHTAVLEPDEYERRYAVTPIDAPKKPTGVQRNAAKPSAATIDAIQYWDEFEANNKGRIVITTDDNENYLRIRDAVRNHPACATLLESGIAERSIFAEDPETGVLLKIRPDWLSDSGFLVDLKTTVDARPAEFSRSAYNYRYHVQAAFYSDVLAMKNGGVMPEAFVFITVEKTAPYGLSVFIPDDKFTIKGRTDYRRNLATFAACNELNNWPCYPEDVQVLSLPTWVKD